MTLNLDHRKKVKTPKRLQPLVDDGLIDEIIHPLMSGKEADVFVVRCGSEIRCAKIYKDAIKRSFKKAAQYTEGSISGINATLAINLVQTAECRQPFIAVQAID